MPFDKSQQITPEARIAFNNRYLTPDEMLLFQSMSYSGERGKAAELTLEFSDPDYLLQQDFIALFVTPVTVFCGWKNGMHKKGPFLLTDLTANYPDDKEPTLTIKLKDKSIRSMHAQKRSKNHRGKLNEIVAKFAEEHGLKLRIDDDTQEFEGSAEQSITQANETDATFLQRLADTYGYVWGLDDITLYFQRPEHILSDRIIKLFYRIGDRSAKSVEVSFQLYKKGTDRKDAEIKALNIDFDKDAGQFNIVTDIMKEIESKLEGIGLGKNSVKDTFGKIGNVIESGALDGLIKDGGKDLAEIGKVSEVGEPSVRVKVPRFEIKERGFTAIDGEDGHTEKTIVKFFEAQVDAEDSATGSATDPVKAKNNIANEKRKLVPLEVKIVPTIPSWEWTEHHAVELKGVAKFCEGIYEVHKVTLKYDDKGLSTELDCKKRSIGSDSAQVDKDIKTALALRDAGLAAANARLTDRTPPNLTDITPPNLELRISGETGATRVARKRK